MKKSKKKYITGKLNPSQSTKYMSIMKLTNKQIVVAVLLLFPTISLAQDIDGIDIGDTITKEQMIAKFGNPDSYSENNGEFGKDRDYMYGQTWIQTIDNKLENFVICDKRFKVLSKYIPTGVRVGDKLSKLNGSKYGPPQRADWLAWEDYFINLGGDKYEIYVHFYVENGIIISISYNMPV